MMNTFFENIKNIHVLILGDLMIDAYLWGKVNRISPEAPVPVVQVTGKENRLGGAANVALNCTALGAQVSIAGVCGDDTLGYELENLFKQANIHTVGLVKLNNKPTTVKTRVISQGQHLLRVDEESLSEITETTAKDVLSRIEKLHQEKPIDLIIFEDYNKGLLSPFLIESTIAFATKRHIKTAVDPKKDNFWTYKNVDLFKPNLKEMREGLKQDINPESIADLTQACEAFSSQTGAKAVFITLSEHGAFYYTPTEQHKVAAHKRKIIDVSGAGDSVISVAGLALSLDQSPKDIAEVANIAGGLVCEEPGVVPIDTERLIEETKRILATA